MQRTIDEEMPNINKIFENDINEFLEDLTK
jgi:hypothetical protein